MKEQIQQLIAAGQTKDALQMLVQITGDALLLQAQYNNGEKQFNLGLIDFGEWQRIQSRVNFAALEMASKPAAPAGSSSSASSDSNSGGQSGSSSGQSNANKTKVFISYNHGDAEVARQVCTYLEKTGLDVIIDEDDMAAGRSIMEFIQDSIKKADAVVSIVSSKSLQSGWVGQESVASIYAVWLADKKFIPVKLDSVAFDIDFHISTTEGLALKIKELKAKIKKLESLDGDARASREDLARMTELKNNLGKIIQRFTSVLMLDISGNNFEPNMKKVLSAIQS
ncbi:MAG TPA: TIR domain-containing protein [Saprospiraceae bacterium]|nr:TIR domain-containing protein [Saprospiraceae bacterium]